MTSVTKGRPLRKKGVWLRQVGGENALYDPDSSSVHLLNDTALAIWDLCDGDVQPDEMIEAICQISSLHKDIVSEDVHRTLEEFEQAGLIEWRDAP